MAIHKHNPHRKRIEVGNYTISDIYLTSPYNAPLSLVNTLVSLQLFEGILQHSVSGNLILLDTENLIASYPIVGYEKVNLVLKSGSEWFEESYPIYSITDLTEQRGIGKGYTIQFISDEYLKNKQTTISRAFTGMSGSSIIKTIFDDSIESDRQLTIEETSGILDFVSPFWEPFKVIDWICGRSSAKDSSSYDYLFFQTLEGYNFVSMGSLKEFDSKITYVIGDGDIEPSTAKSGFMVQRVIWNSAFNMIENIASGMYSNKYIEHDIIKRKINIKTFDYNKVFNEHSHLEDYPLLDSQNDDFQNSHDSKRFLIPEHYSLFSERESSNRERVLQIRASQLKQIDTFRLTIVIDGNLNIRAGDVIYLNYPSIESLDNEDKMLAGRYLVSSVKNTFDSGSHNTVLGLSKDSYLKDIFN